MNKHKIFLLISLFLVITQTLPPVSLVIPFGHTLIFAFMGITSIALFPSLLSRKSIIACLMYCLVMLSFHVAGNRFFDSINSIITSGLIMLSGLLISEYANMYDTSYRYTKTIVYALFACNIFMAIISIPQLIINPDIIRIESHISELDSDVNFAWIMRYQTVHGIPFLFAPLVFLCKKAYKKNLKFFSIWTGITLLLFYIVFRSNAATALLLSILMIAIALIFSREHFDRKSIVSIIAVSTIGVLFLQPAVIAEGLNFLQGFMDSSGSGYKRIEEVSNSLIYEMAGEGDMGMRQDLYTSSTQLFLNSPVWGTSSPELISRHSWIIDHLAAMGILFIIPLVFVFVFNYRIVYYRLRHTQFIYIIGVLSMLIMLFSKNDFGQGSWLYGFAYLPLLCRYIDFSIDYSFKKTIKK